MNKNVEKVKSILWRSSTYTDPRTLNNMSIELPFILMPADEDDVDYWVLNQKGHKLGGKTNRVRDEDLTYSGDLDLSTLKPDEEGNYYLWETVPPSGTVLAMNTYRNLLGKVFKISRRVMHGNRGVPPVVCTLV